MRTVAMKGAITMIETVFIISALITFTIAIFFVMPIVILAPERKFKYPKEWKKADEEFARKMEERRWR